MGVSLPTVTSKRLSVPYLYNVVLSSESNNNPVLVSGYKISMKRKSDKKCEHLPQYPRTVAYSYGSHLDDNVCNSIIHVNNVRFSLVTKNGGPLEVSAKEIELNCCELK